MRYVPGKEYLVQARLMPLAQDAGHPTVDGYVAQLGSSVAERRKVVDALTINETSWFRDDEPFHAFTATILPRLLEARKHTRRISVWSAACSSGQEPYSLAILLTEHLPPGWTVDILASDVCTAMVERVQAGRYTAAEMNRGMPAALRAEHFTAVGTEWQISERLRAMVRTRPLNLAAPFTDLGTVDVVFLRNVLIYFDDIVRHEVLERMRGVTASDGYLLLGSSENAMDLDLHWVRESIGRMTVNRPCPHPGYAPGDTLVSPTKTGVEV